MCTWCFCCGIRALFFIFIGLIIIHVDLTEMEGEASKALSDKADSFHSLRNPSCSCHHCTECWLPADLTLVAGGDSPSAVIDFSSIFSSFVSSSTAVFSISCFFSGLAVLAILQDKNQRVTKVESCFPFRKYMQYSTHHENNQLAGIPILNSASIPGSTLSSSAGKGRGSDLFLFYGVPYFAAFSMACVCVCVSENAHFRSVS